MGRKPTSQELIPDPSKRRSTFKKRAANTLKKIEELQILTDCMIYFEARFKDGDEVLVVKRNRPTQSGQSFPDNTDQIAAQLASLKVDDSGPSEASTDDDESEEPDSIGDQSNGSSSQEDLEEDVDMLNLLFPPEEDEGLKGGTPEALKVDDIDSLGDGEKIIGLPDPFSDEELEQLISKMPPL